MKKPPFEPLDELRESFRAAAAREIDAEPTATRRRPARSRRLLIAILVALGLLGGGAVATELISTGKPHRDLPGKGTQGDPAPGQRFRIAVTARDPAQELPFAVGIFRDRSGDPCAVAGQARGSALGVVRDGEFRPYGRDQSGTCAPPDGLAQVDSIILGGRLLVYGRTRRDVIHVAGVAPGEPLVWVRPGPGGAFLFVWDDNTDRSRAGAGFITRDGRRLGLPRGARPPR